MANTWMWMKVIKEVLTNMNSSGYSRDEEETMRRIMRDVMRETSNANASERDMMQRMVQLLEHNVSKHTAELQATAQERDHYKAKMEELNCRMEGMMRDGGSHPSGGEEPGLADKQKRLAEMWEELQNMRQSKQSGWTTQGKPFNRGGGKGGRGGSGAGGGSDRKPYNQSQNERASFQFGGQNKDGTSYFPGEHHPQGWDSEKSDYQTGGFQSKPFQQDTRFQEGPVSFPKTFPQHGGRDRRRDFGPGASNTQDNHGLQSDDKQWQGDSGPGFSNRDAAQNVGIQNRGPNRGSYQHRGHDDRGQHQQHRGQFQQHRGQFHQQRGQFHQHRGQFHQHRGQFHQHRGHSQDGRQRQRSNESDSRNPPGYTEFTPEEIEAIKVVLKQREAEAAAADCTGKSGSLPLLVNPGETAVKKEKEQKKPKGAGAMPPDDSDSDEEDAPTSSKEDSKKKKRNKSKGRKNQAAAQQKPESSAPLKVYTASGFDTSQIAGLNMDQAVSDVMLLAMEGGNIKTCQPKTVREMVEFKKQYPNAEPIIVKNSEQK